MINTIIVILFCIASIIVLFFSRMWGWIILAIPFVYLVSQALLVKYNHKWKHIPDLSDEANKLFQKYGHYYTMPFAGRDFSQASSTIGVTAMIIAIIGIFFHFWWGILLGVVSLLASNYLGKYYNPSMFLEMLSGKEKQAHEEIISFLKNKSDQTTDVTSLSRQRMLDLNKIQENPDEKKNNFVIDRKRDIYERMSTDSLIAIRAKKKDNPDVTKLLDNILEERNFKAK